MKLNESELERLKKDYKSIPMGPGGKKLSGYIQLLRRKWGLSNQALSRMISQFRVEEEEEEL